MYKTRNLPNTRIDVADALRGIAVAGIILYHSVEHFNIFTQEPITYPLASDQTVADVLAWLLSNATSPSASASQAQMPIRLTGKNGKVLRWKWN